jgi:hypothetical protein
MRNDLMILAVESSSSASVSRARELLDLIKAPTSIATVILLGFTQAQLNRNATSSVDGARTLWAAVAAILAALIAAAIVAVMSPLTYQMIVVNRGGVETVLLVYGLTYLVAIGTTGYAMSVTWQAGRDLLFVRSERLGSSRTG